MSGTSPTVIRDFEAYLSSLNEDANKKKAEIKELGEKAASDLFELSKKTKDLNVQIENKENLLKSLEEETIRVENSLDLLIKQHASLSDENSTVKEDTDKKKQNIEKEMSELSVLKEKMDNDIADLKRRNEISKSENDRIILEAKELQLVRDNLNAIGKTLNEKEVSLQEKEKRLDAKEESLQKDKESLEIEKNNIDSKNILLSEVQENNKSKMNEIITREKVIMEQEKTIEDKFADLHVEEKRIELLKNDVAIRDSDLKKREEEFILRERELKVKERELKIKTKENGHIA